MDSLEKITTILVCGVGLAALAGPGREYLINKYNTPKIKIEYKNDTKYSPPNKVVNCEEAFKKRDMPNIVLSTSGNSKQICYEKENGQLVIGFE